MIKEIETTQNVILKTIENNLSAFLTHTGSIFVNEEIKNIRQMTLIRLVLLLF